MGADGWRFDSMFEEIVSGKRNAFQLELCCRQASGDEMWVLLRAVLERDVADAPEYVVAMIENITDRKRAESELMRQAEINEYQALHDPLTGLPNRILFSDRIGHAILQAQRSKAKLAVALIDLDRFKEINDSLGHSAGDQVLISVGERMASALRASDTVARLGGDEFGLRAPRALGCRTRAAGAGAAAGGVGGADPRAVAADRDRGLDRDRDLSGPREDAQTLIQRADVAMYEAKRDGFNYVFYDDSAHDYDVTSLTLVADLRRAISERELVLYYQPKAALESGVVTSVEALIRWVHPERGIVLPDSFIPLAQETSLIGPLTLYVIEEALRQSRAWREQGVELSIAVNLSTRNLLDRGFPDAGRRAADALGGRRRRARAGGHRVLDAGEPDAR